MKKQQYDEKQLIDQGTAYKISFTAAMVIGLALYFLTEVLSLKIAPYTQLTLSLFVPITMFLVTAIAKDAYEALNSSTGSFMGIFFLVAGIVLLILWVLDCLLKLDNGDRIFIENGELTRMAGSIIFAFCTLAIGITHRVKKHKNQIAYSEE